MGVIPFEFRELRGGAINQGYLNSPMLVSGRRAFPGFQAILSHDFENIRAELSVEQVVPTSYSMNLDREDKEETPFFQTQSLQFKGKSLKLIEWSVTGGHFGWSNIPDKVAYESSLQGNSVIGSESVAGSQFKYDFDGLFASTELCLCVEGSAVQWVAEFQRVRNTRAASG